MAVSFIRKPGRGWDDESFLWVGVSIFFACGANIYDILFKISPIREEEVNPIAEGRGIVSFPLLRIIVPFLPPPSGWDFVPKNVHPQHRFSP